jgi:hypothetical protein
VRWEVIFSSFTGQPFETEGLKSRLKRLSLNGKPETRALEVNKVQRNVAGLHISCSFFFHGLVSRSAKMRTAILGPFPKMRKPASSQRGIREFGVLKAAE